MLINKMPGREVRIALIKIVWIMIVIHVPVCYTSTDLNIDIPINLYDRDFTLEIHVPYFFQKEACLGFSIYSLVFFRAKNVHIVGHYSLHYITTIICTKYQGYFCNSQ